MPVEVPTNGLRREVNEAAASVDGVYGRGYGLERAGGRWSRIVAPSGFAGARTAPSARTPGTWLPMRILKNGGRSAEIEACWVRPLWRWLTPATLSYPARTSSYSTTARTCPVSRTYRYSRRAAFVIVAAGPAFSLDHEFNTSAIGRNMRTLWTCMAIAAGYKLNFTPARQTRSPLSMNTSQNASTTSPFTLLSRELNFELEAENARTTATFVASEPHLANHVYIPRIFPDLTADNKCGIAHLMGDDRASASSTDPLAADRVPPLRGGTKWVMQTMINLFSALIFDWGWARVVPRVERHDSFCSTTGSRGAAQLVLLDHGLYVRLPREFQQQYARVCGRHFSRSTLRP
ncbi:uncharacterized protein TRAVEDRAFT_41120 [Trametes versicolor FP-101664 SS1]|uniref:uncharacterized protein n=1 Tax=Trametes versicolor (strain FP-101664) TaxID=717944 RepID=UPI000462348C|nr:uncharacterized protein TRAVEDRAFT_41120 [Trametes versicolor FP-101664 SS1]EIW63691.1 hypothetical protein TRAVEDRAFT_41120 [Trametes versicolor FP-101664 SS1]